MYNYFNWFEVLFNIYFLVGNWWNLNWKVNITSQCIITLAIMLVGLANYGKKLPRYVRRELQQAVWCFAWYCVVCLVIMLRNICEILPQYRTVISSLLIINCVSLQLNPSLKLIATRNAIFLVCPNNVGDDVIKEATSLVSCTVLSNIFKE